MPTGFDKFKEKFDQERGTGFNEPGRPAQFAKQGDKPVIGPSDRPVVAKSDVPAQPEEEAVEKEQSKEKSRVTSVAFPESSLQMLKEIRYRTDMSNKDIFTEGILLVFEKYCKN